MSTFMTLKRWLAAFAISAVCAAALVWALGGSHSTGSTTSPDDTYRVEFFTPSRLQRLLHSGMEDPAFVRLYNNVDGRLIGSGPIMDMFGGSNGAVTWLMRQTGQVAVGIDTVFWHVHPITRTGDVLPVEHELDPAKRVAAVGKLD